MHLHSITALFATACGGAITITPDGNAGAMGIPDIRCAGAPDAGPERDFIHVTSRMIAAFEPHHRGYDLVAAAGAPQTIAGMISYGPNDKALEDEDVDVFACTDGWQPIGTARTDGEGRFALALTGDTHLPVGMRDMFVSVVGDRSGVGFLAYVAPDGSQLVVSDVDGTLTSSENAFLGTVAFDSVPGTQPGAPDAFRDATTRGMQIVYVTARGGQFTDDTRTWLATKGYPRGPVRLSPDYITTPGADTVAFKTTTLQALAAQVPIAAGIGNRHSDVQAYAAAGLAADRIYIKLPEYQSEVQGDLDAGAAIGFSAYDDLRAQYVPTW